jgi:hypothetical protein
MLTMVNGLKEFNSAGNIVQWGIKYDFNSV